jgi:hypothetical protein
MLFLSLTLDVKVGEPPTQSSRSREDGLEAHC